MVEEAWAVVDFDENQQSDDHDPTINPTPAILSLAVLRIWAYFFKSNTQWPFINTIGDSLEKYRSMLMERQIAA